MSDRVLRGAATVALAGMLVFGARAWWTAMDRTHGRWTPQREVAGDIDHYADDTLFVATSTDGLLPVVVGRETVITNADVTGKVGAPGDANVGALRPGRIIVARGHPMAPDGRLAALTILVFGPGQR